ncbi:hypothetical protein J1614_008781, partial [Plenodomus biglobosus]
FAVSLFSLQLVAAAPQQNGPQNDLVDRALAAMGLQSNTSNIKTVRVSGSQLRVRSVGTSVTMDTMDSVVIPYGSQAFTYDYSGNDLIQRIDRVAGLGALWLFGRPNLEPMEYSLVIKGGNNGSAAVVEGSYAIFELNGPPQGYLDGYLAAVMISEGHKWDPLLVKQIQSRANYTLRYESIENDIRLPAVYDPFTRLSVLFDPNTYLPRVIRSYEDHPFYGRSTNDLRVYNYTNVDGVMIPRQYKTIYNKQRLISDFFTDDIAINPAVPATFFNSPNSPSPALVVDDSLSAQILERSSAFIWFGPFTNTLDQLEASQPYPDMPGVWVVRLPEVFQYRQILLEMSDHVVVLDAPPEQAAMLIEWSKQRLGKPIRQVWPTHHHHDHAFGVNTYVAAGAEVIVPEMSRDYYTKVPGIKFKTYSAPFVIETANFRAVFIHVEGSIHAVDHSIGVITPPCPTNDSTVVVFDADHVVNAGEPLTRSDANELDQLVAALSKFRVAKSALLVPSHGPLGNMSSIYDAMGYQFPEYRPTDFEYNSQKCAA